MKIFRRLLTILVLVNAMPGLAADKADDQFVVVGYTRNYPTLLEDVRHLQLDKITHLNIAFLHPDPSGKITAPADLKTVAALAHGQHVKVLISIGGGEPPEYLPQLLGGNKQAALIASLTQIATENDLDGIDVDLESKMITRDYESFVTNLGAALRGKGKMMTAAVATFYGSGYTDKALAQFDRLNVMSYDKTGPWDQDNPGQHAPYEMAVQDLDYWVNKRGIAKRKVILGLPFYGYGFGAKAPAVMTYREIISQYPGSDRTDQISVKGGGAVYYNGISTIEKKVKLALRDAGGVMIWELSQDAADDNSLLKGIHDTISTGSPRKTL